MYHLSAACVDRYMVDTGTVAVEDQVSRFQIREADLGSAVGLCTRRVGQADSIITEYRKNKSEQSAPLVRLVPPHT